MPTESTSLKNVTPTGDSNTSNEMVIEKKNTYQRPLLIVGGSLLALLVWIAVAGTGGGQHLQSSTHKIAESAMALADYQVDSANLPLTKDIFGIDAMSQIEEGTIKNRVKKLIWNSFILCYWNSLTYKLYIFPSFTDVLNRVSAYK